MSTIQPIDLLSRLVAFGSVSSVSNSDVSDWVSEHLESLGFRVEQTSYVDTNGETKVNVVGCREPQSSPRLESDASGGLAYFCHTDVVPPGDWVGPGGNPYDAVIQDHRIFARGACDMKGSLAAMLCAAASVQTELQSSPLWIVCTADEEIGFRGARHLIDHSEAYREIVAAQPMSIIGEPTMLNVVHAHKGIYGYQFTSRGKAAHSSTEDGVNANIAMVPMLQTLLELGEKTKTDPRDHDGRFDPPTLSWNFGISEGGTAINVTAEQSVSWLSLRPMPQIDGKDLIEQVAARAKSLGLQMETLHGGDPLWVDPASECVRRLCVLAGGTPQTVCFGTDGGEFAELKHRVVWGPGSIAQAHTADEWLDLNQLSRGIELFTQARRQWCC